MPAVLKLIVEHLVTFFIVDGGKKMCLDKFPRQKKPHCIPLQNNLDSKKFAFCIPSHSKTLILSIYFQIGETVKPGRK